MTMMNISFTILLVTESIVHAMLFFRITYRDKKDDRKVQETKGFLWMLSSLLFMATVLVFTNSEIAWTALPIFSVLLSQCLIILHWKKIWYVSLLHVMVIAGVVFFYLSWKIEKSIEEKIEWMESTAIDSSMKATEDKIQHLPLPVQKWLRRTHAINNVMCEQVFIEQKGQMRTSPGNAWMNVNAKEYFTTTDPAFLWIAKVDGGLYMKLKGIDNYRDGKGHMQVEWFSVFPVVNASGNGIDQGSLLRYLAEIVWFPSAALRPYIHWEEIDATHAKATMNYGQVKASGIFTFNGLGDVVSFEAKRYYDRKEGATLEDWVITIDDRSYKEFQGIRVPTKASITWKLKSGTFNWFNLEVQTVNYNLQKSTCCF